MAQRQSFRMHAGVKEIDAQFILPGAGVYIYWQMGALSYLREHFDLQRVTMTGASAGAVVAVCAATNVDPYEWMEVILKRSEEAGVWDRKLGALGIAGDILAEVMDTLIPKDAAKQLAKQRVTTLLQPPQLRKKPERVSDFNSRGSVLDAVSATIHIPLVVNGKVSSKFRGKNYIDGAIFAKDEDFIDPNCSAPVIKLSTSDDPHLQDKNILDCIKTITKEEVWDLYWMGRACMDMLDKQGKFDCLTRIKRTFRSKSIFAKRRNFKRSSLLVRAIKPDIQENKSPDSAETISKEEGWELFWLGRPCMDLLNKRPIGKQ